MATMTAARLEAVRVVLVDDHPAFREAVRGRLATTPHFQVVGEAGNTEDALAQIRTTRPHLAVIDISFGRFADVSGLVLARKLRELHPETRVLICSGHADYVDQARAAGVRGYILKNCHPEEIVKAIEVVACGACYYSADVERASVATPALTVRETEVLKLVARSKSSKEIARELKIDPRTVDTHRGHIMDKLEAKNTVQMLIIAFRLGLIDFLE
jgi:DNA-binding NarL/FixJ family response regulator